MRKLITSVLFLLAIAVHAQQIGPDEAAAIASDFLNSPSLQLAKAKRIGVKRARAASNVGDNSSCPYYVFNGEGDQGFVIVAGDKRAKKILGYSDTGNFDFNNLPPQLEAMLDQYAEQIASLPTSAATDPSWSASARTSIDNGGVLLETANWGQGYPYNAQCPEVEGQRCVTGCVATAMAIVMKYHNWPEEYDWDTMPMEQPENPVESLSKLMVDAGEAVLMNYGTYESGAEMNWVGHRLQQRFRYSPDCQYITSVNFSNEEWISLLRGNLDNNKPVIYTGRSGTERHAFIIDGYQDSDYHINWGWNGVCNGYFALNALNANDSQNFSSDTGMVINILPDKSGKEYSTVFCDWGYFWATGGMAPGSHFSVDSPKQNQAFDYTCYTISYPCDESGQIGLLLYDKNGKVKEVLKSRVFTEGRDDFGTGIRGQDIRFSNVTISSDVQPDDYITLATRKTAEHPWLEVLGTLEAPLKTSVAEITKEVCRINIINKVPDTKVRYAKDSGDYMELESDVIDYVKGSLIRISVSYENGGMCKNTIITVVGKGIYGNIHTSVDGSTIFGVYDNSYIVTIEERKGEIEKIVTLTEAGRLSEVLSDTPSSDIGSLTIRGYINAKDLWFIRDNLQSIKTLDISETKIEACDAIDPVESFRIEGTTQSEDVLPTYALTGLIQLNTLKLPKGLKSIESNSLMSLKITRIEIPSTVQTMGVNIFFNCPNLQTVVCRMSQPPFINDCVFTSTKCPASGVLYIPTGTLEAYSKAEVWQDFAQIIEDDNPPADNDTISYDGLKYRIHGKTLYLIGYEQSQLPNDVIIPEVIPVNGYECTVLGIDDNAMQSAKINSFIMPNSIITIGESLFTGSSVKKVKMSDNIKYLPFGCIIGDYIEELNIPENAELICNSIYCPNLKKLHLPKNLHSETGSEGSIGRRFQNLEEITVDPENEEWSVHEGLLYWKGLSHLILVPNTMSGELIISNETTHIGQIEHCDKITKIIFGNGIKSIGYYTIEACQNLKHVDFNNNIIFSRSCVMDLYKLESFTIRDFIWADDNCFCGLPSLKYVYLMNAHPVDFSNTFYRDVNPQHDYYSPSLNPQATVPDNSKIFVPGGTKAHINQMSSNNRLEEMWEYEIDRSNCAIKVKPLIDGLVIDSVTINGVSNRANPQGIYSYISANDVNPDVVVAFMLHERQSMTTHYDTEFNTLLPDTDLTKVTEITLSESDLKINVGQSLQLSAVVAPEYAVNKAVEWSSSNPEVATVDQYGNVSAVAQGTTTIIVKAIDGSGVSASCEVTVNPILVESLAVTPESWNGSVGETFQITAAVTPENATDKTLVWSTSDETVAIVNDAGVVSVLKAGSCVITVSTVDGSNLTAECIITGAVGIDSMFADDVKVDVYNVNGVLLKRGCGKAELKSLAPGVYIVRSNYGTKTIVIY